MPRVESRTPACRPAARSHPRNPRVPQGLGRQCKTEIEGDYLERFHEIRMLLFELETSRMVLEEEVNQAARLAG